MRLFGKKETLNERLLREAQEQWEEERTWHEPPAAAVSPPEPLEPPGPFVLGTGRDIPEAFVHRPREFDAVVVVEAPGIAGREVQFVVLPDESLLVEEQEGESDLSPLADAVQQSLAPPFRVRAVRADNRRWNAAGKKIEVIPIASEADVIDLTHVGHHRTLHLDGVQGPGRIGELETLVNLLQDYAVHAERLDGELFEVQVSPL